MFPLPHKFNTFIVEYGDPLFQDSIILFIDYYKIIDYCQYIGIITQNFY